MSCFSLALDNSGTYWQFKTGFDSQVVFKIGAPVPYFKNEALAMDVRFEDDVIEAVEQKEGEREALVVIKNHRLHDVILRSDELPLYLHMRKLRYEHAISEPNLSDWSDDAQIAWHLNQILALQRHKAYMAEMNAKHGVGWEKQPGAYIRMKMREPGLFRRMMDAANALSVYGFQFRCGTLELTCVDG